MPRPDPLMSAIRSVHADSGEMLISLSERADIPHATLSVLLRNDHPRDLATLRTLLTALHGDLAVAPAKPAPRKQLPRLLAELRTLQVAAGISQSALSRASKVNSKALHRFFDADSPTPPLGLTILCRLASALRLKLAIQPVPTNGKP